jgi:hypothetical protein
MHAWLTLESDMNYYLNIQNIELNGQSKTKTLWMEVDDLTAVYDEQGYEPFIASSITLTTVLLTIGWGLLSKYLEAHLAFALAVNASMAGFYQILLLIGIALVTMAIITAIVWIVLSACWI